RRPSLDRIHPVPLSPIQGLRKMRCLIGQFGGLPGHLCEWLSRRTATLFPPDLADLLDFDPFNKVKILLRLAVEPVLRCQAGSQDIAAIAISTAARRHPGVTVLADDERARAFDLRYSLGGITHGRFLPHRTDMPGGKREDLHANDITRSSPSDIPAP